MTLQDRIERVQAAISTFIQAETYWQNRGDSIKENQDAVVRMRVAGAAFCVQASDVQVILAAHAASRLKVQEAHDKLESIWPQLMAMLEDAPYIMRTVREVATLLEGETIVRARETVEWVR